MVEVNKIRFRSIGKRHISKNDARLSGLSIAEPDHEFYWTKAVIEGSEIVVFIN